MNTPQSEASLIAALLESTNSQAGQASRVTRADIVSLHDSGLIEVVPVDDSSPAFQCDILDSAISPQSKLEVGDIVLVLTPGEQSPIGCILGRVSTYVQRERELDAQNVRQPPDHVVVEAGKKLTLKCGDASLDLRKDGKLMIRGVDVLTRAKRTQRIKGGTVAIN